ncbi:NPCBM/NEW2 domain-containing protein [Deinococcus sp.]|uniref:NPCBM/NEW2 domain-containing protein n=1 Tax=Deinococcus sp. TaxID=47478 RepID=UPI003B5C8054
MMIFNRRSEMSTCTRRHPLTWLTLAVPLLFACGQNASVPVNPDPYAGGVSYPWAYTAPEGQLSAQSLTADINTLSFEKIISAKNGWGPIEVDRSNGEQGKGDGKTLTLNNQTYQRGFGVHAGSEMRFSLKGTRGATCKTFSAIVGLDDEVEGQGSVVFQVYLDGAKAYDSGVVSKYYSSDRYINLDIRGKKELRLVVTSADDGRRYDHADWIDPKVDCRDTATMTTGTLDPSFGIGGVSDISGSGAVSEPDGSLIVVRRATIFPYNPSGSTITRLRPDGTRQLGADFAADAILRQTDGKIVVAGVGRNTDEFSLARLTTNLQPDPTFGNQTGAVGQTLSSFPIPNSSTMRTASLSISFLAQQADGKLILGGGVARTEYSSGGSPIDTTDSNLILRYTVNGALDRSFGDNGVVLIKNQFIITSLVVRPNDKIVVTGLPVYEDTYRVTQLNADGSLDASFGIGGRADTESDSISNLALESDGNLICLTYVYSLQRSIIKRISPTGSVIKTSRDEPLLNGITNLTLARDGKILFIGSSTGIFDRPFFLVRLKPDLSLDTAFGAGGKAPIAQYGDILQQTDGKIVVVTRDQTFRYFP